MSSITYTDLFEMLAHIGEFITAFALIVAGVWALVNYRVNKQVEAARWLHELSQEFQFSDKLSNGKFLLDFRFREVVEPLLSTLIIYCNKGLKESDLKLSVELDRVLNQFEHLLFLESNGRITRAHLNAYFGYWFGLFKKPEYGTLRRYCHNFGYELIAQYCFPEGARAQREEYILVYGSLRRGTPKYFELGLDKQCEYLGERCLRGKLYDLGDYPGLILEPDEMDGENAGVSADLFRINEQGKQGRIFEKIDIYEECNTEDSSEWEYRRTTIPVKVKDRGKYYLVDAWVYVYQQEVADKTRIDKWPVD
ncbi:hypothetical protein HMF8227_00141 [Saliniradius amylolyticus]|uniref:Gamma-glutamylcyclotransferase AIG2-like domain-containing protein n=1 Tax=Saliniradius amylolyticus TaxID=2183582 RepID=A0A2S2DZ69_9ALTE|nr:gamma-glutamylcyclotransferase family protein [Saliniradius amylolyticus]AWL10649.1 hypothetical protein HMF8227_00141 [Saliniradius amylolyticus]